MFTILCSLLASKWFNFLEGIKTYWRLNGLGDEHIMFTTSMICTPCSHSQMLVKLSRIETIFVQKKHDYGSSSSTAAGSSMAFVSQRNCGPQRSFRGRGRGYNRSRFRFQNQPHQNPIFASQKRGFFPAQSQNKKFANST